MKASKKSIFYSSDQPNQGRHHRLHSSKPNKGTSSSSTSSASSSNRKSHRRRRRRRTTRSKSHKRASSTKFSPEKPTDNSTDVHTTLSSALDNQSISDDESEDEEKPIDIINNQLAKITFQDAQELCDDSDSLDEALDAELLDDENENCFNSSNPTDNLQ